MKRLIIFASSLALAAACNQTPNQTGAPGNSLAPAGSTAEKPATAPAPGAQPIATSGDAAKAPAGGPSVPAAAAAEYREVTLPAGTVLPVDLGTTVGSDISRVEQPVEGTLRRP